MKTASSDPGPNPQFGFEFASQLNASTADVWAHATAMSGVNRELFPLARMTHPTEVAELNESNVPLGRRIFRSWILAGGLLPIDYDDLTIIELEPGHRFLECSTMMTQRQWIHERIVEPAGDGSVLTDRVTFTPRIPALGPIFLFVFRLAFRLRHHNLRRIFNRPDRS